MLFSDFEEAYTAIAEQALTFSEKARREGLLALEPLLDSRKYKQRDIMDWGLRLVIDATEGQLIDKILTNIIALETDADQKVLKIIQKEAVLAIQSGLNPRLLALLLNSYVPFGIEEAIQRYNGGLGSAASG